MMAHLMDKGLDACLKPRFNNKLPAKESSPRDNDEKREVLNKKTMCQFIQAFTNISLLNKVNLKRKASRDFPSGKAWKLWQEMQEEYNPDDSMVEAELELALGRLKLSNKTKPRKLIEQIAWCK